MADTEELAERIREELSDRDDISERKMFGGTGFMLAGNLCAGAQRDGNLLVRIDPETSEELTADPHARAAWRSPRRCRRSSAARSLDTSGAHNRPKRPDIRDQRRRSFRSSSGGV